MSLYTYVPGRDELFELMIDRAWAVRGEAGPALPWRDAGRVPRPRGVGDVPAHPWLIHANLWRMPLGPHVLDIQEDLYRAVRLTGLAALRRGPGGGAGGVARLRRGPRRHRRHQRLGEHRRDRGRLLGVAGRLLGHLLRAGAVPDDDWIWENQGFEQPPATTWSSACERLLDGVELLVSRSRPSG